MVQKEVEMSFFKRLLTSIKDIDKYYLFTYGKLRKGFLYLFELCIIFGVVVSIASVYGLNNLKQNIANEIDKVPEYRIENNEFSIDSDTDIINEDKYYLKKVSNILMPSVFSNGDGPDMKLKILLSNSKYSDDRKVDYENYDGIFVGFYANEVLLYNTSTKMEYTYEKLKQEFGLTDNITKEVFTNFVKDELDVSSYLPSILIANIFRIFISSLIILVSFSILGYIYSKILKMKLTFASVVNISISAMTLPLILQMAYEVVKILTDFRIVYFDVLFTIISYLYIVVAIYLMHKNPSNINPDLIKVKSAKDDLDENIKQQELDKKAKKEKEEVKKKDREQEKKQEQGEGEDTTNEKPAPQANFKEL